MGRASEGLAPLSIFRSADYMTKSIFPEFADDTKQAEEGGRGDR